MLVVRSLSLSVVKRVDVETAWSDVELKDCRMVRELEGVDDVSCGERLNDKGDAASAVVVGSGSNERHGK